MKKMNTTEKNIKTKNETEALQMNDSNEKRKKKLKIAIWSGAYSLACLFENQNKEIDVTGETKKKKKDFSACIFCFLLLFRILSMGERYHSAI